MNNPVNIRFPDGVNAYCPVFREIGSIRAILLSLACETATIVKSTFARLPFVLRMGESHARTIARASVWLGFTYC
ncbi:MAG: hypothetical protein WBP64_09710 [Nitrososphaeraceae archaeon]